MNLSSSPQQPIMENTVEHFDGTKVSNVVKDSQKVLKNHSKSSKGSKPYLKALFKFFSL